MRLPTALRAVAATVGALIAVGYYELNVGAVMGAGFVLALFIVRRWSDREVRWRAVLGSTAIVLTPACLLVYGRTVTGDQAESYGGTTVRLGRVAVETFGLGVLSSLPGAAWGLSIRTLGGTLGIVWLAMAVVALLAGIAYVWVRSFRGQEVFARPAGHHLVTWAFVLACVTFWFVAVALQAITVKVQDEVIELGYVYTSYCVGAAVVSLGLAAGIRALVTRREYWGFFGPALLAVGLSFVLVQLTVNWRLSEQLNAALVPNRQLLAAFDDDRSRSRSVAKPFENWTAGGWPDYYEVGMVDGLEVVFQYSSTSRSAMALLARRDDCSRADARGVPRYCIRTTPPFVDRASAGVPGNVIFYGDFGRAVVVRAQLSRENSQSVEVGSSD